MYTKYAKEPAYSARVHAREMASKLTLNMNNEEAKKLYDERYHFLEVIDVCLDLSTYLIVLSLRATSKIDIRAHLHVSDDLVGYGRDAMYEMLVIRLRGLFHAEMNDLSKFKFFGFHQTLEEYGKVLPRPNLEINNAIARIIRRRNFYSAHHGEASKNRKEYTLSKNRLYTLDLTVAVSYIAKVEQSVFGTMIFDPFERLINEELDVDRPLALHNVYEVVTGSEYEELHYTQVLETLHDGTEVVDGDYEYTPEFVDYQTRALNELKRIRLKVGKIVNSTG